MSMNMMVGERLTCPPKALIKDGADLSNKNDSWGDHLNEKDSAVSLCY